MVEPGVPPNAGLFLSLSKKTERGKPLAKVVKRKGQRQKGFSDGSIPFAKENYVIMGIGIAVIVGGYLSMLEGSIEGFLPLVVSPVLLVIGYCVIVPFGILYKKSNPDNNEPGSNQK